MRCIRFLETTLQGGNNCWQSRTLCNGAIVHVFLAIRLLVLSSIQDMAYACWCWLVAKDLNLLRALLLLWRLLYRPGTLTVPYMSTFHSIIFKCCSHVSKGLSNLLGAMLRSCWWNTDVQMRRHNYFRSTQELLQCIACDLFDVSP